MLGFYKMASMSDIYESHKWVTSFCPPTDQSLENRTVISYFFFFSEICRSSDRAKLQSCPDLSCLKSHSKVKVP